MTFQVYTDHSAISFVKKLKEVETNSRLARWAIFLQGYQFDITQKKGKAHTNADGLSRREYPDKPQVALVQEEPKIQNMQVQTETIYTDLDEIGCVNELTTVTKDELTGFQRNDADLRDIIGYIEQKELPDQGQNNGKVI